MERVQAARNNHCGLINWGYLPANANDANSFYLLWNVPIQIFTIFFFHKFRGLQWIPL